MYMWEKKNHEMFGERIKSINLPFAVRDDGNDRCYYPYLVIKCKTFY